MKAIYEFLQAEYKRTYNTDIGNYNWNYLIGSNSRTNLRHETPLYVIQFAQNLSRGNLLFTGVTKAQISQLKENMLTTVRKIGVTKDLSGEITDFTLFKL